MALRGEALSERLYFAEMQNTVRKGWGFDETAVAGYSRDLKLVIGREDERLYALESDPNANTPVERNAWPDAARPLEVATAQHRNRSGSKPAEQLSPDVERELRALGYIR